MNNRLSFWFLVGVVLLLGFFFFRIVQPFLAPLFFGAVLALLVYPLYAWAVRRIGGRERVAAGLTLIGVAVCVIPVCVAIILIGHELMTVGDHFAAAQSAEDQAVDRVTTFVHRYFPETDWQSIERSVIRALATTSEEIFSRTQSILTNAVSLAVGLAIMSLSIYYFLVDGKRLVAWLHRLSPFEDGEEARLIATFGSVCRGVVLGMLSCAIAQATLTGIGLWLAGVEAVWILTGLTLLFSMIPLIGAAGVYGPVAIWLMWQGNVGAGLFLGAYGGLIVSTSDNLIRAQVLNGSSGMHPLLALVSALGALKLVGLWGIFLGPIVAALFYTLAKVLHDRVEQADDRVASHQLSELGDCDSDESQPAIEHDPLQPKDSQRSTTATA